MKLQLVWDFAESLQQSSDATMFHILGKSVLYCQLHPSSHNKERCKYAVARIPLALDLQSIQLSLHVYIYRIERKP